MPVVHRVRARNLATTSSNKIHDDEVARRYGFAGGLVPGVEVYAYATHAPVATFGPGWLSDGAMDIKLVKPVYDGRMTTVEADKDASGTLTIVVRDEDGEPCATATASVGAGPQPAVEQSTPSLPEVRAAVASETLAPGTALGALVERFDVEDGAEYVAAIGEDLPVYAETGIAHPGWLLGRANYVLAANVALGPWIHVGSDVRCFGTVADGERVCTRATVSREWEKRDHRFVELDVQIAAGPAGDQRLVVHTAHTAIYQPRQIADPMK